MNLNILITVSDKPYQREIRVVPRSLLYLLSKVIAIWQLERINILTFNQNAIDGLVSVRR